MKIGPLVIFLTVSISCAGQFHTIFNFSVSEGLPSSEVYEAFQDRKGFIWFATDNGVARFDGYEFELFHVKDGLTDPVVFGFFQDDRDRIWFRTFSGKLCYLEGHRIKPYAYNDKLIQSGQYPFFNFVYDSESDELWFSLARKFGKITENGIMQLHRAPTGSSYIKSINGQLLQATDISSPVKSISINGREYPVPRSDTTESRFFNATQCRDRIYVSIYKDLFEYNGKTVKRIISADHPIISLSKDRQGHLWIGYLNHGAEKYISSNARTTPSFLINKSVTKVLQDAASGYWFCTLESGVYYVPTLKIDNYKLPTTSRIKAVLSLGDSVLLGDQSGNLFFFDADRRTLLGKKTYKEEVYALFQDSFKNIWVSAGTDIIRYTRNLKQKIVYRGSVATTFSEAPDHSIWAYGGIRLTEFDQHGHLVGFQTKRINYRTMLPADSVIYFAGRTGLHIRDKRMNLLSDRIAFKQFKISQIRTINDTIIALATHGNGLILLNKKTLAYRQFDTDHQFPADNIYCLTRTDSTLWVGTERGLVAVNVEHLLRDDIHVYNLSRRTGLLGNKINFILEVKHSIWAFDDNGFSVIPKTYVNSSSERPLFYLKNIIAGADTIARDVDDFSKTIALRNRQNHLTITFGYICFSNQNFFLRYRILPESEWIPTSDRTLQLYALAPGDYHFELQYSHDNTQWISPFSPLAITVDSPWWLKWYTVLAVLILIVLAAYIYSSNRQAIYEQRNHYLSIINSHQQKLLKSEIETLDRERNRIAKELHDGVGTNLSAIKLMVNQILHQHRDPRVVDIEEQFQFALKELKDIIYGLTPPGLGRYGLFRALQEYVSKLNKSLSTCITLESFGAEIKNYEFNITVFRIIQELIANSIKHASANRITIHVNSFEDMLSIMYEDDGKGFTYEGFKGGLGLDNIESRLQAMNGTLKFASGDHGISYAIDIPVHTNSKTE